LEFFLLNARTGGPSHQRMDYKTDRKGEGGHTVEVIMAYEHVIDALARKAGRDELVLLFQFEQEGQEALYSRGRDIIAEIALDETLCVCVHAGLGQSCSIGEQRELMERRRMLAFPFRSRMATSDAMVMSVQQKTGT
jgi:hypothetical protein